MKTRSKRSLEAGRLRGDWERCQLHLWVSRMTRASLAMPPRGCPGRENSKYLLHSVDCALEQWSPTCGSYQKAWLGRIAPRIQSKQYGGHIGQSHRDNDGPR